jgi:hypothetical protein
VQKLGGAPWVRIARNDFSIYLTYRDFGSPFHIRLPKQILE